MPLYDFTCRDCGCEFEALMLNDDVAWCENCGGPNTERKPAPPLIGNTPGRWGDTGATGSLAS